MNFITSIKTCFRKYCVFKGRACRAEFWYFELFTFLLSVLYSCVWGIVALPQLLKGASPEELVNSYTWITVLVTIIDLGIALPSLGVATRRLHDTGRSGWWLFAFYAIIIVGSALLGVGSALMASSLDVEAASKGLLVAGLALLIPFLPMGVVMLVWLIQKGTKGPNRYGDDPTRTAAAADDEVVDVTLDASTRRAASDDSYKPGGVGKSTLTLLVGALMLTSLASCEAIDSDTIVGRWQVTHAEVYGMDMPVAEGDIYNFRLNGSYTIKSDGKVTSTGSWDYSDNLLTLFSDPDEVIGGVYDVVYLTSTEMSLDFDFGFVYGGIDLVKISTSESRSDD